MFFISKPADLNEFSLGQTITDAMKHALESLVQYRQPTEQYSLKFTEQATDLLVEIEWDNSRHGKDITARLHVLLNPAADNAHAIRELMKNILQTSAAIKLEAATLTAACTNLEKSIQPEVQKLEAYAKIKEELENDIALKGAALLVAKQQHLNELLHRQQ
jgi:DNA double-strand break repair and V(D)J recombination protein XRCC4